VLAWHGVLATFPPLTPDAHAQLLVYLLAAAVPGEEDAAERVLVALGQVASVPSAVFRSSLSGLSPAHVAKAAARTHRRCADIDSLLLPGMPAEDDSATGGSGSGSKTALRLPVQPTWMMQPVAAAWGRYQHTGTIDDDDDIAGVAAALAFVAGFGSVKVAAA
jgi:hypothetical protein